MQFGKTNQKMIKLLAFMIIFIGTNYFNYISSVPGVYFFRVEVE